MSDQDTRSHDSDANLPSSGIPLAGKERKAAREKTCRSCKRVGGPWPNGDRPKSSNPLQSGCPRCGWCY